MQIDIRHAPSFAVARIGLAPGEAMKAESGAMMAASDSVTIDAKAEGGLAKGIKRSVLAGESLFVTTFAADKSAGWVDLAAQLPGDLVHIEVAGAVNLSRKSWLCSLGAVEIDTKWGGLKNLLGGEGGFLTRAHGKGAVLVSCYGAVDVVDLAEGERLILDSGHLVAFDERVQYATSKITRGLIQTLKSGEGLVFEFTGPGRLWTQSRSPKELTSWLTSELPFKRS